MIRRLRRHAEARRVDRWAQQIALPEDKGTVGLQRLAVAVGNLRELRIGAQRYLDKFYGEFGFTQVSDPYDEDGIMHIEMLRAWPSR